jgi:lactate dehydrogenase-like 2-hydroxyacid dehydrogenase
MHHHIVGLEAIHIPYPEFIARSPDTASLTSYVTTSPSELPERVKDATIIIATTVRITAEILSPEFTPHLQAVAVMAAGTDHVDLDAAKARGIAVFNCPHASSEVVANHAIGLYFAARRKTVVMHSLTVQTPSEWKEKGSVARYLRNGSGDAPLTAGYEVCGIVGYGAIGTVLTSSDGFKANDG